MRLWGISLLYTLLTFLAMFFGILPIIYLPILFVLEAGMASVFLAGVRGKEVRSDHLFSGFTSFFRFAGGIGWRYLWILLWGLIPIVGGIFAVIKVYTYRFVPFILLSDEEISAGEALRKSEKMTMGYKGRMFGADLLLLACVFGIGLVLGLLSLIPYAGVLFLIILFIFYIVVGAFAPLLLGLLQAAFYDEIEKLEK